MDASFLKSAAEAYAQAARDLPAFVGGYFLVYLAGVTLYGALRKKLGVISAREAFHLAFPPEMHGGCSARADRWNWLFHLVLWGPLTSALVAWLSLLFGISIADLLTAKFGPRIAIVHESFLVVATQFAALIVSTEFAQYVVHYACHRVPVLWSMHRVHHSAEALTIFSALRANPIEYLVDGLTAAVSSGIGVGLVCYLMGSPLHQSLASVIFVWRLYGLFYSSFSHSHIPVSYGKLNYVLGGPLLHHLHHSAEQKHRDKNFCFNLMIFDWIFGTLYIPKKGELYKLGIDENERGLRNPHLRLRDFYLEPFAHAWTSCRRSRVRRMSSPPSANSRPPT